MRAKARTIYRGTWVLGELAFAFLAYLLTVPFSTAPERARARWLQRTCQRLLRAFDLEVRSNGLVPSRGLLVSNHLSYLDILVLGSLAPARFVSKHEVRAWPVLGMLTRLAGTVFIQREKRGAVAQSATALDRALASGELVILFPEGTSSGGETVLPFKSSLLEPAAQSACPIAAACLDYTLDHGSVADEVCYWRDMTLFPHLLNLLGKTGLRAEVCLSSPQERPACRKELARLLHAEILTMKHRRTAGPALCAA